jgi:hypothetical protein
MPSICLCFSFIISLKISGSDYEMGLFKLAFHVKVKLFFNILEDSMFEDIILL